MAVVPSLFCIDFNSARVWCFKFGIEVSNWLIEEEGSVGRKTPMLADVYLDGEGVSDSAASMSSAFCQVSIQNHVLNPTGYLLAQPVVRDCPVRLLGHSWRVLILLLCVPLGLVC